MKKIYSLFAAVALLTACSAPEKKVEEVNNFQFFGDTISAEGVIKSSELYTSVAQTGKAEGKLEGVVASVCQKKGCWMQVALDNGDTVRVSFKDYGFFMPKDIAGKTVIIDGFAFNDTTTVDMLRHYAEDAGQSPEEIAKINTPEIKTSFEAHGVILK